MSQQRKKGNKLKSDRILFINQVREIYPASKATIYREIKAGRFPKQVACGLGRVGWLESDVLIWLSNLKKPVGALPEEGLLLPIGSYKVIGGK